MRIEVNGASLGCQQEGAGSDLLLIHAGICDRRMWDPQWDSFARHFRVTRVDLRGFGESNLPPGSFSHAEDLVALADALGIERFSVVGVSMGAGVALELALTVPERVGALIVSTTLAGTEERSPALLAIWDETDAALSEGDIERALEIELRAWVDGPHRQPGQVDAGVRDPVAEMNRALLERALTVDPEAVEEREPDPPVSTRLAEIAVPTLVIATDFDQPDVVTSCARLAAGIPRARSVTIEGAAHLPNMEQPARFTDECLRLLSSTPWL